MLPAVAPVCPGLPLVNGFSKKLKQYPEAFPLMNGGLKSSKIIEICLFSESAKKIV